jgi:hypothetical protein
MTTKEAFEALIKKKNWHKGLGITATAAYSLAGRFRDGEKISTDKIEDLLEKAGGKVIQEKLWEMK